jgi:hypothetical protein
MTKRAPKTPQADSANGAKNGPNSLDSNSANMKAKSPGEAANVDARELLYPEGENKPRKMPTTLSEVIMDNVSDEERKRLVTEIRREYQRQYYQKHKEKAKEYQRQYNLTHKKKARGGRGKANFECPRENVRSTFNTADLMHSPVEKTVKMLEKIINGERMFTM